MTTILATCINNRIAVKFPFNDYGNAKMQDLGASFHKPTSSWRMPLTLEKCHELRAAFGDRLKIADPLKDWAWDERRKREELERLRSGECADAIRLLTPLKDMALAPDLWKAISARPYQLTGAAFALTGRNVLMGDQPGLGKTYQALAAVVASQRKRILIVAPRTAVRSVWESHIKRLCPFMTAIVAQGSRANRQAAIAEFNSRADSFAAMNTNYVAALVVSKEMIRVKRMWQCDTGLGDNDRCQEYSKPPGKRGGCPSHFTNHDHIKRHYPEYPELFGRDWDYIVMDECHHALASRYNIQSDNITQIRLGAVRLPLAKDGYKLGMSGTPYRSKAQKAWGTLNWLQPKTFGSFWRWAEELFKVTEGRYAREISQKPNDPDLFADRMRPYLIARTKAEVAPELPPITYAGESPNGDDGPVGIWLDMDPMQAKAYTQMAKMADANIHNGNILAVGVLAELTRLKQFACSYGKSTGKNAMIPALPSNKYDWVKDFLEEREGFDGKVIIASQFTSLLEVFDSALRKEGREPLMLTGKTTDRQRVEFQRRIQDPDDKAWIGLINMRAGGEAITLDQADDMILLDLPWTDDEIRQVEDRIHRISRIHNVTVYRLGSRDTVDQRIAEMTDEQRADLMALRPTGRKLLSGLLEV